MVKVRGKFTGGNSFGYACTLQGEARLGLAHLLLAGNDVWRGGSMRSTGCSLVCKTLLTTKSSVSSIIASNL